MNERTQAITTVCPKCSTKGVPILYGEPNHDGFVAAARGEYVLGGFCIGLPENVGCPACETKWEDREYRDALDQKQLDSDEDQ